ncbi:Cobalt/magnesium transport protein CorA [Pontiella desulfatans]|uniref:Magnesium transport protein CorA n=1 Tax=Pontiella desulfatans TaxID=2750659 RepID=A0A6C2U9R1_PONDE|nr:magnesium/cobalt transporter CorA [Pontiella desulfatans]VGO16780.1 Cobalt/magnesium transport protein CorA [Pontiella desulfatans]
MNKLFKVADQQMNHLLTASGKQLKRLFITISDKQGTPPGTMVYTGKQKAEPLRISVMDFDAATLAEQSDAATEACLALKDTATVSWINVTGLNDTEAVARIGKGFGIHPLVLEDILHTTQRPKLEDLGDYLFLVVRMLFVEPGAREIHSEQISFILTKHCLITFQERAGDVFDEIRDRLRQSHGRIRKMGPDYLLYALMDAIVDNYFVILEKTGEQIEGIEQALMENPNSLLLNELYAQKRELLYIRKAIWPLREAIGGLERGESNLLSAKISAYLRDLYDHTIQVIDTVETFRDMLSGVQDLYLSSMGHKTNQVMQVLTIIATIFIPLTFVAGIYGMNFEHMPELGWKYSYPVFWVVMVTLSLGMLYGFRRMKWF